VIGWLAKTTAATGESLASIGAGKKRAKCEKNSMISNTTKIERKEKKKKSEPAVEKRKKKRTEIDGMKKK